MFSVKAIEPTNSSVSSSAPRLPSCRAVPAAIMPNPAITHHCTISKK
jgi:hypothetical protein